MQFVTATLLNGILNSVLNDGELLILHSNMLASIEFIFNNKTSAQKVGEGSNA